MPIPAERIRKVLIISLSNLGDAVLTLPVFAQVLKSFPGVTLHALAGRGAKEVFEGDERVQKLTIYDKKAGWREKLRLVGQIRSERYDLVIDLRKSALGLLAGARHRNSYFPSLRKKEHRLERHLGALKGIADAQPSGETFLRIVTPRQRPDLLKATDTGGRRLVVAAVGSKSDLKKWPTEHYARLLDRLALSDRCQVLLVGDVHDAADAVKLRSLMRSSPHDFSGKTNYKELCYLLKSAQLVVTNDSAPLHIADALDVPTLALFGPTDPRKYGPRLQKNSDALTRGLFCSPCEKAQCRFGHHECLRDLGVDRVYSRALEILNGATPRDGLKILIVRLDRIGDVALSLPAVAAVRRRHPGAHIALMTRAYTRDLVEGHPLVDEVVPYAYEKNGQHRFFWGYARFIREIRKRHFDAALVFHPSLRSHLVPFLAGIPERVGFGSRAPYLLTRRVADTKHEGTRHESEYTLDIACAYGAERAKTSGDFFIPVFSDESEVVQSLLKQSGWDDADQIIAFHPGASCPSKRWSKEQFAELGKKVSRQFPYRLALVGGSEERPLGEFLKGEWGPGTLDLTGRLNLRQTAAFLKRCSLLVSNDSGPVHIAAAVGTSTLTIFGRKQPGLGAARWKALGPRHATLQKDVGCVVCLAHRCNIEFECLKAVDVEEVFLRLKEMVEAAEAAHSA